MDLGEWLDIPYETKVEKALKERLLEKEKIIEKLQNEIEILRSVLKK
jgi:hypothetical protein